MDFNTPEFNNPENSMRGNEASLLQSIDKSISPLIKKSSRILLATDDSNLENAQLSAHFGGYPYFEADETWPRSASGRPMEFICQIFNEASIELPDSIQLLQLFYDMEELPWENEQDGWMVKLYPTLKRNQMITITPPTELEPIQYIPIRYESIKDAPDWDALKRFCPEILKTITEQYMGMDEWEFYHKSLASILKNDFNASKLSGYANWHQYDDHPLNHDDNPLELLLQLNSEEHPDLMWGDTGKLYLFFDPNLYEARMIIQG